MQCKTTCKLFLVSSTIQTALAFNSRCAAAADADVAAVMQAAVAADPRLVLISYIDSSQQEGTMQPQLPAGFKGP